VQAVEGASEVRGVEQEVAHHPAHCFVYIRQAIMYNADTNLEGKTMAGPDWRSKRECKDYNAVLAWADDHTVSRFRDELLADKAVL
jgi:hypothetical protein